MAPSELEHTISALKADNPNILVGIGGNDDASVYKLRDDLAIVQTVDFITPVVDEPYLYGQIAAANSLSDVFAMGARVVNALNVVGFDSCNLSPQVLEEILAGGASKVKECGGEVTGGHTIETPEMYYGLSATGIIHPNKILRNNTPKVGDVLILTKPLGTGIMSTVIKADMASEAEIKEASGYMSRLNQKASEVIHNFNISACTDITGFGLLGHAQEMANENVTLTFKSDDIPLLTTANEWADMGLIPAGSYKNMEYVKPHIKCQKDVDILLFDAQTSGGLLIAVDEKDVKEVLKRIKENGDDRANIVGYVKEKSEKSIEII